jgi:hypothetical protein
MARPPSFPGAKPRIRVLIPVWGEKYLQRWLQIPLPSLKSPNNLPYLRDRSELEIAILTKRLDRAALAIDPQFLRLIQGFCVKFIEIDDLFPPKPAHYAVPLTLSYARGIEDLGEQATNTYVILLNADFVFSDGSLRSVHEQIVRGYTIVTAPSIRAVEETAHPALAAKGAGKDVLVFSGRELMSVVFANLHATVESRTLNDTKHLLSEHYHQFFWRLAPDCLAARFPLLMPLCFKPEKPITRVVCPVDYGFITELTPSGRFTVLQDSDDFLMLEMQHVDSEAAFIRPAPQFDSEADRLEYVKGVMARNIAEWSTAEHRRSARQTLLFHSGELPERLEEKLGPFEALASDVLDHLPPAVSHTGHFHWISALHGYRAQMQEGSIYLPNLAPPYTKLIQNDCNVFRHEVMPNPPREAGFAARLRALRDKLFPRMLETVLDHHFPDPPGWRNRRLAVAYFGEIPRFLYFSRPDTPDYRLGVEEVHHLDMSAEVIFRGMDDGPSPGLFCLCAPIGALNHWSKVQKSCDAMLRGGCDVTLIYFVPNYQMTTFNQEYWILSRMLSYFPRDRYHVSVAAHPLDPLHRRYLNAIAPFRGYGDILKPWYWPALLRIAGVLCSAIAGKRTTSRATAKSVAHEFWVVSVHLAPPGPAASNLAVPRGGTAS